MSLHGKTQRKKLLLTFTLVCVSAVTFSISTAAVSAAVPTVPDPLDDSVSVVDVTEFNGRTYPFPFSAASPDGVVSDFVNATYSGNLTDYVDRPCDVSAVKKPPVNVTSDYLIVWFDDGFSEEKISVRATFYDDPVSNATRYDGEENHSYLAVITWCTNSSSDPSLLTGYRKTFVYEYRFHDENSPTQLTTDAVVGDDYVGLKMFNYYADYFDSDNWVVETTCDFLDDTYYDVFVSPSLYREFFNSTKPDVLPPVDDSTDTDTDTDDGGQPPPNPTEIVAAVLSTSAIAAVVFTVLYLTILSTRQKKPVPKKKSVVKKKKSRM